MKVDPRIPKKLSSEKSGFLTAPIGIERPETKNYKATELETFKCRNDPASADSSTYEVKIPHFRSGSAEEWFLFIRKVENVFKGQGQSTGPAQFATMRRLLTAEALAQFNAKATELGTETVAHFKVALQAVTDYVLPKKALQTQKRYLRRICRKPPTMTMKEYIARYREINDYLAMFNEHGEANKLPDDEIKENLEFAIPAKWRKSMIMHGFDPIEKELDDFTDFCERLEVAETIHNDQFGTTNGKSIEEKPSKRKRGGPKSGTTGENRHAKYECRYHGPNNTHGTHDCKILKAQAEKMAASHANLDRGAKRARFENKTWKRDPTNNNGEKDKKKSEMYTFIEKAVSAAVKEYAKHNTLNEGEVDMDDFNYNIHEVENFTKAAFDKLSLSDMED